ncbi:MAG: aldo/keto reductase [Bacteroidota bacterium]
MLDLHNLSSIGIGTYRMRSEDAGHKKSLEYAIKSGINLIDTASNYNNGSSEKLVGQVIPSLRSSVFINTKAGYVQQDSLALFKSLKTVPNHVPISDQFLYCIDPLYLEAQIQESLKRLHTDYIDCFLIHNPEHYFRNPSTSADQLYADIDRALDFLETQKSKGIIRYFGLSSNTLPNPLQKNGLSLLQIQAQKYAGFKFIQFPYNLLEVDAALPHYDGQSLIELAKSWGLQLLSNRPFNAQVNQQFVRLVDFEKQIDLDLLDKKEGPLFEQFVELLNKRIAKLDPESNAFAFEPMIRLRDYRKALGNFPAVQRLYHGEVFPFIDYLYEGAVPKAVQQVFQGLEDCSRQYSYLVMQERSNKVKAQLYAEKRIQSLDDSFTRQACTTYLKEGIDHVLVGLRSPAYVEELRPILR